MKLIRSTFLGSLALGAALAPGCLCGDPPPRYGADAGASQPSASPADKLKMVPRPAQLPLRHRVIDDAAGADEAR